jgi:hypothetical protein
MKLSRRQFLHLAVGAAALPTFAVHHLDECSELIQIEAAHEY